MSLMDLMRIDPWEEMNRIQREMNRLFDEFWRPEWRSYPPVNIWTNPEKAILTAELPGYDPKDIQISVVNDEVRIKGNRRREELGDNVQFHRQERDFGEFERTIRLPFMVESDKVEANFRNGVLTIELPRAEADKPRKIEIKSN